LRKINLIDEPNEKDEALIRKRLQKPDQAPSSRQQSYSYQFFHEQVGSLGNPYDITRIPISVLEQMQRDPMIAFGMHFIKLPIIRSNWYIKCERPDIATFIDNSLRRILSTYINQRFQALYFGFAPIVKRFQYEMPTWKYYDPQQEKEVLAWDEGNIKAITWKPFVNLPSNPSNVQPRFKLTTGEFNGIKYEGDSNLVPFGAVIRGDNTQTIDLQHSLWLTNEKESANGSLWGFPRIGYAYRFWWSKWFRWALYDRFFERKSDPPLYIYYPTGGSGDYTENDDGDVQSMKEIALGVGEQARAGGVIALPGNTITGYDDRPTSIREWELGELEVSGDMSHFIESFEYLDVMTLRAIWIAEQALIEGKGGTSSRNVAKEEISLHKEGAGAIADEIDDEINRWVIPDLIAANFPEFKGDCVKITTGFTDSDRQMMREVLQWVGQSDPTALRSLDVKQILERAGMPTISMTEIRRQEKEAERALIESQPPLINPEVNQSGINEEGFYVPAKEQILLAENTEFIISLPKSKHYQDKKIINEGASLKKLWKNSYADIYENFASFISKENFAEEGVFNLADEEKINALVEKLIDKWKYPVNKLNNLFKESEKLSENIINRAGEVELRNAKLDPEWEPDKDALASFLEERGLFFAQAIEQTVKDELRSYLGNAIREGKSRKEIANGVREHFADFPDWKADRLVRSEIRNGYNFATLVAGEQAGIKIVQARDAQLGDTDPDCIERNGKFFKISDALSESAKEHPNGTLEWIYTKRENLSIEYIKEMPGEDLAYFDSDNNIAYLKSDIPLQIEKQFLIQLGDTLKNEL